MVLAFLLGAFTGSVTAFFIAGATQANKENEYYMEGFNAGKADKLDYELGKIKGLAKDSAELLVAQTSKGEELSMAFFAGRCEAFSECKKLLEGKEEK